MLPVKMFGVDMCQCYDPYEEWPVDGLVFCETCHGLVRYVITNTHSLHEPRGVLLFFLMFLEAIWEQIKHPWWSVDKCVDVVARRRWCKTVK